MGLAERFKDKIEQKDIFQACEKSQELKDKEIKFISKPVSSLNNGLILQSVVESKLKANPKITLEDLETEIISKIRKTPYWKDYSFQRQENMISSYLRVKLQMLMYKISPDEQKEFVHNVLVLSNNR